MQKTICFSVKFINPAAKIFRGKSLLKIEVSVQAGRPKVSQKITPRAPIQKSGDKIRQKKDLSNLYIEKKINY
jgi:N-glycosylase/DNA lyase